MPNTLIHLGLQGAAARAAWRGADLAWVYLGCLIPDLPWIARRAVLASAPPADPLALQVASGVQSSLAFCLLLAGAIALVASKPARTFALLAAMSLLHLLLDAAEIKWANGIHLLAPLDWRLTNYGVVWPDHPLVLGLTGVCAGIVVLSWRSALRSPAAAEAAPGPTAGARALRWTAAAALLAAYVLAAPRLVPAAVAADTYFAGTLREVASRPGRAIAMDRAPCVPAGEGAVRLTAANGETMDATGFTLERPALVSVEGRFETPGRLRVERWHVHAAGSRDLASAAGVGAVGLIWLVRLVGAWRDRRRDDA